MNDLVIRTAMRERLPKSLIHDHDTVILEELGLKYGAARVDMVVVNGSIHGFELKSDLDSLTRLPVQTEIYSAVLDKVTLVVGYRHANCAMKLVPDWWGVELVHVNQEGQVLFEEARPAVENPTIDPLSVAKLLWRDEALDLLRECDPTAKMKRKSRSVIFDHLVRVAGLEVIRSRVRRQLKHRINWRPDAQRM